MKERNPREDFQQFICAQNCAKVQQAQIASYGLPFWDGSESVLGPAQALIGWAADGPDLTHSGPDLGLDWLLGLVVQSWA